MQHTTLKLSLIASLSLLWGCDSTGLETENQQSTTTAAPISTVVQLQADPVVDQSGEYIVPADRTVELLPQSVELGNSLPYHDRTGFDVKSLHPDFWPNRQELVDADTAGVAVNLLWENWQPTLETNCSNQVLV